MKKITTVAAALALMTSSLLPTSVLAQEGQLNLPEFQDLGDGSENLALNMKVSASSNEGTAGRFENAAVDGNMSTRWASRAGTNDSDVDQTWYCVDLGKVMDINKIDIHWESRPNKFKIQISEDGEQWSDLGEVIDNGELQEGEPNAKLNTLDDFGTVKARFVKMQGIERRRHETNGNTGYSIYEIEVYGPAWSDETFVNEYLDQLSVPSRMTQDTLLPIADDDYGVNVSWESDSDALTIDAQGNVSVVRGEQEQKVTLKAIVTRNEAVAEKVYEVTIPSNQPADYSIYPVPASMKEKDGTLIPNQEVTLVMEDEVDDYTKQHIYRVLDENGMSYSTAAEPDAEGTNVILGIADGEGAADDYFAEVDYDRSISTDKSEGYVLDVDEEKHTIAVMGHENTGTSYGLDTLDQMLDQGEGELKEVLIEDAPETEFRGFIEGFYGEWTHENRMDLIRFCGENKMNTYIYGPKSDPYHTAQWRDPYPAEQLAQLAELVETGKQHNVEVVWAAHVGGHIDMGSDADIQALMDKFDQLYDIGVRQFAVFFDDSSTDNTHLVDFLNTIQHDYVDAKGDVKPLIMCPQYYNKNQGGVDYLRSLSQSDERIQIMWTGDNVVSEVNQSMIDYITDLIGRPVYVWWNYPVNDLGRSHLLHMGPTEALQPGIENMSGLVSNPMIQAQASKVSLFSIADYTWNSEAYDSQLSWENSWARIITDDEQALEAFKIFCQNCASAPMSFAQTDESVYLIPYFEAFERKLAAQEDYTAAAAALCEQFQLIIDACDTLDAYQGTGNISAEIRNWVDTLRDVAEVGKYVFEQLQTLDPVSKDDDQSIIAMINFINDASKRLNDTNAHTQKAAQKRIYPFIESVLSAMAETMYPALGFPCTAAGFGSANADYSAMTDGQKDTYVELGAQVIDDHFGIDLKAVSRVTDIHLTMGESDEEGKQSYYKEGVLEYSADGNTWTQIGTFDTPQIDVTDLAIQARYIRYRATAIFEDITNGVNLSNIRVMEMSVNESTPAAVYTNASGLDALSVSTQDGQVTLTGSEQITLQPGEYVGVQYDVCKTLYGIQTPEALTSVSVSTDGEEWNAAEGTDAQNAKYIRLMNEGEEAVTFTVADFTYRCGGRAPVVSATNSGGSIYSGNASNTVDGDASDGSAIWYSNANYATLEYTFETALPLASVEITCTKDVLDRGHIDISEDGETWRTVSTFTTAGNVNTLTLSGDKALKMRLCIDKSGWVKISEVNIQVKEDMSVLSGDSDQLTKAMDGNLLTSYDTGETAGSFIYNNVNSTEENTLVLVKDPDTQIRVEGMIDGEWQDMGTYSGVYNEIRYPIPTASFRISWDEGENVSFYELMSAYVEEDEETASEAAIQALRNMVDKANALGSDDEALKAAIEAAQAVLDKDAPTSTEVVTALLDLSEAMQALNTDESTDALRADVQATIDFINEHILTNADNVRPGKVQALKDAVAAAEKLLANPDATADELKAANKAMTKAAQELWEIVTKAELEALIEAANGYLDGDYTAESLEALQAAITAAQAVADNDDATVAEVTEAITNLSDAIANLESIKLDTSALVHEIELVNEMLANIDNYVPSSVEGLADKLADAQNVLENAATQAEIDEAVKTLREARLNARTKADVSALEELIAYAKSLDLSGYTTESAQALIQDIARAENLIADPEITQEEAESMVKELQASVDELVEVNERTGAANSTNTAAAAQTGLFAGVLAAAGAALIAVSRRKKKHS